MHGKNLIDIQKPETNSSLVLTYQTVEEEVCAIHEVNYCQQQKDWRTGTTYTLSQI